MKDDGAYLGINTVVFYGVVEDINDPLKVGRVRVRAFGWQSDDKSEVPTEHLPWAQVVQAHSSAASGDVGVSPSGLVQGSWVVGMFIDGKSAQVPIVFGAIAGIPSEKNSANGFNDPDGEFPRRLNVPDVNRLARGDSDDPHPITAAKDANRVTGITSGNVQWDQPVSDDSTIYPKSSVSETVSGHVKFINDAAGLEKILEYHKSGTFTEINAGGDRVVRVLGDGYEIVTSGKHVYVGGVCNITVDGDANISVGGEANVDAGVRVRVEAPKIQLETVDFDIQTETYNLTIAGESHIRYDGDKHEHVGADSYSRHGVGVNYSCPVDPIRTSGINCEDVETAETD